MIAALEEERAVYSVKNGAKYAKAVKDIDSFLARLKQQKREEQKHMSTKYTKKQIQESIAYWQKQLDESQASDAYELACIPQIKKYIVNVLGYDESSVFADDGSTRMSPLSKGGKLADARHANSLAGEDVSLVDFHQSIQSSVPNFDKYTWFIFHTGYENSNSDILVAKRNQYYENLRDQWAVQNIEIKRYASSYLFQPQFECSIMGSNGTLKIDSMSHAYINSFDQNASKLNDIVMNAIWNDPGYAKMTRQVFGAMTPTMWLEKFMAGAESKNLLANVEIPNVEELVKTFYFDLYDLNRQVTVFQIGNGKNARLFKVSNVKSTEKTDPLKLIPKCNSFSSAFNTILLTVQARKIHGKFKVYGKIRFSNKAASKTGSFDPNSTLPS